MRKRPLIASDSAPEKPHKGHDTNKTRTKYPDSYYKAVYLSKKIYEAADFIAYVKGAPLKQTVEELMEMAIGMYIGQRVAEQNQLNTEARERGEPVRPVWFTIMLRHWAHLKGYDIGKFI